MKNTTKHAGVVAAVLTAAGITGACPGTAFAAGPSSPGPADGSPLPAGISQPVGSDHRGGDDRPIVVHGPVVGHGPVLGRGPILDGGPNRRGDHDGPGWRGGDDRRIVVRGPVRRFDDDDRLILDRGPVLVGGDQTAWVSRSQTGTICSVDGGNIVVDGADGTTWTWTTGTATTFRVVGAAGTLADLRVGERIVVTGLIDGSLRHAETVVAVGDPQPVVAVGATQPVVAIGETAAFRTGGHVRFLPRHERTDHCEHAGQHRRGDHCEHPAPRGGGRGGRHRG